MTPRRLHLLLLALVVALTGAAGGAAAGDDQNHSGDNAAVVVNTRDDSTRFKFAYDLERESGDVVDNQNVAWSQATCERCRTTAIAVQIVLVSSKPGTVTPTNLAVALNENCTSCQTFATAFQFVVGVEDASVRFTKAGKKELKRIIGEFRSLRHETYTLDEFHTRTGALADQIRTVLRTQLVSKGDDDEPDVRIQEDTEGEQG
jgi:hypothetical protein